jgi:hypothetical protein
MSTKVLDDAAQLLTGFNDKSRLQICVSFCYQLVDFQLQCVHFLIGKSDSAHSIS